MPTKIIKNQVLIFFFAQMNAARCIGEQNQKNNQLSGLSFISVLFFKDNDCQFRRQLLTIIYNKNTACCAYKNNQKSSAYLLFLLK